MNEFCDRCKEDFPVADVSPRGARISWSMGLLYPRHALPQRVNSRVPGSGFICGNCCFDLTDEEE